MNPLLCTGFGELWPSQAQAEMTRNGQPGQAGKVYARAMHGQVWTEITTWQAGSVGGVKSPNSKWHYVSLTRWP